MSQPASRHFCDRNAYGRNERTEDKRGRSFAAEVPAGPDATILDRLIAFTGRAP